MSVPSGRAWLAVAAAGVAVAALAYVIRQPSTTGRSAPRQWFVDRALDSGLDSVHFNGMSGGLYLPEVMAPGLALFDFDNDGDLDVFVPQGQMLGNVSGRQPLFPPKQPPGGRLFRNDLQIAADGSRVMRFTDVTAQSGIQAVRYGMGAATADFDNDGWIDLYLTNLGPNQLLRNNGDGTFTDVSSRSGTAHDGWSVSASWFDYDRDGWLDLFVATYLNYTTETDIPCHSVSGARDYCAPFVYSAQPSHLFRNRGDGTFTDVTVTAGLSREFGPALGASTADFNGDGWIDLFVANDLQPNQLWINRKDGTFTNTALFAGVAVGPDGTPKSSMGVDAGDFDNDGDEDLFVTELTGQGADLYVNDGTGVFRDQSASSRLRIATLPYTGFGTGWFDFDNDGWLDLAAVNGLVMGGESGNRGTDPFPFAQIKQLFRNLGNGQFEDVSRQAGPGFQRSAVGRGLVFGDLDNDGDTDLVVSNANGPVELLLNDVGSGNHWVGLRLTAGQPPRTITGARVAVVGAENRTLWRRTRADGSYASASDPRVIIGLGSASASPRVRVAWPDGAEEEWTVPIDRYTTLTRNGGRAVGSKGSP